MQTESPRPSTAGRAASLAYGLFAYLLFLGVFVWVLLFVMGWIVPTTIGGGREAPLVEALLVNGGILALFAVQHTIMARRGFKQAFARVLPAHLERSTFVLASSLILALMVWQWRAMPTVIWSVDGALAHVLTAIALVGWGVVLLSTFLIDHFDLFGVRQVVRYARGLPQDTPRFQERLFYKHVRHPLMSGFLLAFWATPHMSAGHLYFAALSTGYILLGLRVEERDLEAAHGETYREYRRRVPMLLPLGRKARGA